MIINHNMNAMNAHRNMASNTVATGKSMEKLSSGLRINRAGDDAAGLSISEKMRGQIRGLEQASRNSQDGISLIQTTEGALNETHSILQRMRELSVQASNDTNTAEDRGQLTKELDQLRSEIDRISSQTQFNKMDVLNGDGDKSFKANIQVGANSNQAIEIAIDKMDYSSLFKAHKVASTDEVAGDITVKATKDIKVTIDGKDITIAADKAKDKVMTKEELVSAINKGIEAEATLKGKVSASFEDNKLTISRIDGVDKEVTVKVESDGTNTKLGLGTDAKSKMEVFNVDLTSHAAATGSISAIDRAIEKVSTQRSQLGAYQNRLEHTIKNVDNAAENLQAAESRVRDVDMANEMMTFSKNNILTQAAQAMLAQANQQPQGVLQLLR
ncbi:flagellin N-terminal helical domain-containing protein [Clostridium septicum]|uniref:Flagellin n=1 Tax=Clostridium septicum TaxID=1504 RepID=A0A9N7JKA3_CLOSE|nr:flagellin [Clostridium septicum]AYE33441.1 flagellin [Clostridium septicum]UEC21949.1 flagellin [Clostridium septicum]USS00020.1 flagellin [Clostridium septicum]